VGQYKPLIEIELDAFSSIWMSVLVCERWGKYVEGEALRDLVALTLFILRARSLIGRACYLVL
jgi:hypothetical protein